MSVNHEARVFRLETAVTSKVCEGLGSVRGLTVALLVKYGEWDQLLDLECDPRHYADAGAYADDYLCTELLKKNPRLPTGRDKRAVAIGKFRASEDQCASTNRRISDFRENPLIADADVRRAIIKAQGILLGILGGSPGHHDLVYAYEHMRFGPGATTSLSGIVSQGKKYAPRTLECTPRVADFRTFCLPAAWSNTTSPDICLRRASKLTTVPKNAKTDRVICIEPDLNIYVQLGFGALLRDKLRRNGLDLNTQDWNRLLAKRAAELGLCTLDLSSASDTISREAVWLLLPHGWADALHFSRVDYTSIDGVEIPLEKWSSMGNGYTFELESLLFWAVLRGCLEELEVDQTNVATYGDDLIFPLEAQDLVVRTLNFLGFNVNREKTFGEGLFHESCGCDYFGEVNVRPVFLRTDHHDFPTITYIIANNLRRWAHRRNGGVSCDVRLLPAWLHCFTACDKRYRHRIPEGFGDVGFIEEFDRATPSIHRREDGWAGYIFEYRRCRAMMRVVCETGAYLAWLNKPSSGANSVRSALDDESGTLFSHGREALRSRFDAATTETGYVLTWPTLGPWA